MVTKNRLGTDYGDGNEGRETSPNNRQLRPEKNKRSNPYSSDAMLKTEKK